MHLSRAEKIQLCMDLDPVWIMTTYRVGVASPAKLVSSDEGAR